MQRAIAVIFILFFLFEVGLFPVLNETEFEKLYNTGKYDILLEKSISLLNVKGKNLSDEDKGLLYYYTAIAYIKNKNNAIGLSYLLKIEKEFSKGKYLKYAYRELIKYYDKDKLKQIYYSNKLISEFPKTVEAFKASIKLGEYYLKQRKFNYAINVFEKIVNEWNMGDVNPKTYILLALSYAKTHAYLDALDYLRIAKKKAPKLLKLKPDYLFESSKIYYNTQNYKEATNGFRRFLNVFPKTKRHNEVLLYLSKSLMKEKKYNDATIILLEGLYDNVSLINYRSLENKKKYYSLLLNLTQSLIKLSKKEKKILRRKYKTFTDIDKNLNDIKNNSINYNERRTATVLLNNKYLKNGDIEGAIINYFYFLKKKGDPYIRKKFREYLNNYINEIKSEDSMAKILKLWLLVKPRKSYMSGKNLMALADNLVNIGFLKNAGDIYMYITKYTLFKKYWKTAQNQLAKIRYMNGNYKGFLEMYDKLFFDIKNKEMVKDEFLLYKIEALEMTGQIKEARKLIEDIFIKKINTISRYKLLKVKADILLKDKKISKALDIYKRIIKSDFAKKNKLELITKLADLYYLTDKLDIALDEYKKLEDSKSNIEWILFQKINIYRKKKDKINAKLEMNRLMDINPKSFWLKQLKKTNE